MKHTEVSTVIWVGSEKQVAPSVFGVSDQPVTEAQQKVKLRDVSDAPSVGDCVVSVQMTTHMRGGRKERCNGIIESTTAKSRFQSSHG